MANLKTFTDLKKEVEFNPEFDEPKRGELYYIDMTGMESGTVHILQKNRPALIIQNNIGNRHSDTVVVALITSTQKKEYPMHYRCNINGIESTIVFEQIMTIDKSRLLSKYGELTPQQMREAEEKLMYELELNRFSLTNVLDIDVINRTVVKTRVEEFISFTVEIYFEYGLKQDVNIKLDKLREFNKEINENIEFDELRKLLNCCKGLNWLCKNNDI